jgi:hypothetical protein
LAEQEEMSRIRSIHPGLWTDEAFVSLSPMARLLIMGIWNECDDTGSFAWSPLTLKMRILPADNADAAELLAEMVSAGIIMRYEVAGKAYGAVRNFCQFQRPKKPNSIHPQTDEVRAWVNTEARSTRDGEEQVPNQFPAASEIGRQMEDGGGNRDSSEATASSQPPAVVADEKLAAVGTCVKRTHPAKHMIPEDWTPPPIADLPPRSRACAQQWTNASYLTEAEAFLLYWRTERKMKTDWRATWASRIIARHSAIMRDQKFGNAAPSGGKVELTAQQWRERAEVHIRFGRHDNAEECRRKAIQIEQRASA